MSKKKKSKKVEIYKQAELVANDGRKRYVTLALRTNGYNEIVIGYSICTYDEYDPEIGKQIALGRTKVKGMYRTIKLKNQGLLDTIPLTHDHHMWLRRNQSMLHSYAEYMLQQFEYNINEIIWPDNEA